MPRLDRASRMMVRTLKTIREFRQDPTPAVTVGQAQGVNVAEHQVNTTSRETAASVYTSTSHSQGA